MFDVDRDGPTTQAARRLMEATTAVLAAVPAAAPFVAAWPRLEVSRPGRPSALPVLRWLPEAAECTPPTTAPLARGLANEAAALEWRQSYAAAELGPDFLERYGWTELIGTKGPVASAVASCGFLVLGPHTLYPAHAHEAEELYLPLAGTARWRRGDDAFNPVPPGTPVHHPSWLPHAMQTGAEPLVALYCWRGGTLGAKPTLLEPA